MEALSTRQCGIVFAVEIAGIFCLMDCLWLMTEASELKNRCASMMSIWKIEINEPFFLHFIDNFGFYTIKGFRLECLFSYR